MNYKRYNVEIKRTDSRDQDAAKFVEPFFPTPPLKPKNCLAHNFKFFLFFSQYLSISQKHDAISSLNSHQSVTGIQ